MSPRSTTPDALSEQLQRLLQSINAGGRAVLPRSSDALLSSIVEAAARIFGAAAASILLVNEEERVLVFRVAYGAGGQDLVGKSFPLGQGIAGYVAMTGQPLAIADVEQDATFNRAFAKQTGYVPKSILAMPLLSRERVIGVMEVLDKISAPAFGMQDMELLAMFARQAALAIEQSQQVESIDQALIQGLRRLARQETPPADALDQALALLQKRSGSPQAQDILALADVFAQLSTLGAHERRLCLQILASFAEYGRAQARRSTLRSPAPR
jgi:GAF domain-containing protein